MAKYLVKFVDCRQGEAATKDLRVQVVNPGARDKMYPMQSGRPTKLARRFPTQTIFQVVHESKVAGFVSVANIHIVSVNDEELPESIRYVRLDEDYAGNCVGFIVKDDVQEWDFQLLKVDVE